MPKQHKHRSCNCRNGAQKAYSEIIKTRKLIANVLSPNLRAALRLLTGIDRATHVIATELRKHQLDANDD